MDTLDTSKPESVTEVASVHIEVIRVTRGTMLLMVACATACGSNAQKTGEDNRVAECVQYQSAFDACFHRDSGFASQPAMIPKTGADRSRLRQICSENLQRLKTACH